MLEDLQAALTAPQAGYQNPSSQTEKWGPQGLNNIARHAEASQVAIYLNHEPEAVELRIQDDGRGLDPEKTPPGHYGLGMMRERATMMGAKLSITSQPGHGTEIVIRWAETQEQKGAKHERLPADSSDAGR